jgi:hypothetical protein
MGRVFKRDAKFESLEKNNGNVVLKFSEDKFDLTFIFSPDKQREHIDLDGLNKRFTEKRNITIEGCHSNEGDDYSTKAFFDQNDKNPMQVFFESYCIWCNKVLILPKKSA